MASPSILDMPEWRIGPDQWPEAIAAVEGPQLIVAGPGTGKTEFLVERAAHLIRSGKAMPQETLLLTFSRRAAADLRRRVSESLDRSTIPVFSATFHSFAHRLLESVRGTVPSLLTSPEQVALVSQLLAKEDTTRWPALFRPILSGRTLAAEVADFLMRCRERLLGPAELEELSKEHPEWQALPGFFSTYLAELARRQRIDYGSLLAEAVEVMAEAKDLPYRYVLVDEYQDSSPAQARLLELLVQSHRNITAAADPYQSIYGFRGADLSNVAAFSDRFRDLDGRPGRRMVLDQSFRVPKQILSAALRVTAGGELPGGAGPVMPAPHEGRVEAYLFDQQSAEAEWIAAEVDRVKLRDGVPYGRMAVLVRSKRTLLPELSRALERRRIPHDQPDARLVDHPAARIIFDLVTAATATHGETSDRAMRRVLLGPLLSLSLGREREVVRTRVRTGEPWSRIIEEELGEAPSLAGLLEDPGWAIDQPAADGFWHLWSTLPQLERLVHDRSLADFRAAWSALAQALERQNERDPSVSLADYLALTDQEDFEATPLLSFRPAGDRLALTTLHQAKGLEFEVVFLADATEGVFPDLRRSPGLLRSELLDPDHEPLRSRLREEMRLAYTAMTRARSRVVWTATQAGIDEGSRRPSRFLLAASGCSSFTEILPPPSEQATPITVSEVEAHLRRLLTDPRKAPSRRLAAASVLAHPPNPDLWDGRRFAGVRARGSDRGWLRLPLRLSPTQAELYDQCPRRYALERRLRAGAASSPYLQFGSLVHEVLEAAERPVVEQQVAHATLTEALASLDRVWERAQFGTPVLTAAWKRRAVKLLTKLYLNWPGAAAVPLWLERDLSLEIDGVKWSGRADRIEQTGPERLRIVDYKTGTAAPSVDEAGQSIQLGFYVLAADADPDIRAVGRPTEAQMWFPLSSTLKTTVRRLEGILIEGVRARMKEIAAGIAAEEYPPRLSEACGRCAVRLVCPAWPEGREAWVA